MTTTLNSDGRKIHEQINIIIIFLKNDDHLLFCNNLLDSYDPVQYYFLLKKIQNILYRTYIYILFIHDQYRYWPRDLVGRKCCIHLCTHGQWPLLVVSDINFSR